MRIHLFLAFSALISQSLAATVTRNRANEGQTLYDGQLTDTDIEWDPKLANPKSPQFDQAKNKYENAVKTALVTADATKYANSEVTVVEFRGQRASPTATATIVQFILALTSKLPTSDIENDLQKGSSATNYHWKTIKIDSADIPQLPEVGDSPGWKAAADMILKNINPSIDPCQDFFNYTCHNYISSHKVGSSVFGDVQVDAIKGLTKAIDDLSQNSTVELSETLRLAMNVYNTCKKVKRTTFRGPQIVLDIANEYGGWPVLDPDWNISHVPNDVYWMMGDIVTKYGVSTLLSPLVEIDAKRVDRHVLYLDESSLALPAEYYRTPSLSQRYQDLLRSIIYQTVHTLTKDIDNATLLPQIDRMVQIEVDLAMISINASEQRNQSMGYNPYDVSKAQREFPDINWPSYLKGLIGSIFEDDPATLLDPFMILEPRRFARDLDSFLAKANLQPSVMRDLVNYLIFRLISPYMEFAGPELAQIAELLKKENRKLGDNLITVRDLQCVQDMIFNLPYAVGRIYIDWFFQAPIRDDVSVLINNILSSFSLSLGGLPWMDNVSALRAFQKVNGLIKNVGYPDFQEDDTKLDAYYDSLIRACRSIDPTDPRSYYLYTREIVLFQGRDFFGRLKQPTDRTEFGMSSAVVNAWYQPIRNSITFPSAILNPPFYRLDYPRAVNYGGLGVVTGHELGHAFDDQGTQFDWDGSLNDWMTPYSESGFKNMAQCVVDQYSQFCYPEACINGITTQGENIGDNGGLKASYHAYKAYVDAHGEEKRLPGLETFTMDQIFFIAQGVIWCGSQSEDSLVKQLLTNPHSPAKDRVIGEMQNFPPFAQAFGCKKGDPMYPAKSCNVW